MPRIADHFLDSSLYFYTSIQEARDGASSGGSGFLVQMPSVDPGIVHVYAVTNKHVIDNGCHVIRVNKRSGGFETIQTEPDWWHLHPEGDDIAVFSIDLNDKEPQCFSISTEDFITHELIDDFRIGPGDEVFLIGRLVTMKGRQRNTPVVRFGNISMMADSNEPIIREDGISQESFLIDCKSLSGFSGSPVFVTASRSYSSRYSIPKPRALNLLKLATRETPHMTLKVEPVGVSGIFGPWLLGIDWGHISLKGSESEEGLDLNTGIACVAPAWRILDVLNDDPLRRERKRDDEIIARRLLEKPPAS